MSILFPRLCPMCGEYMGEVAKEGQLCPACIASLPRTEQDLLRENETETALWGAAHSIAAARRMMHLERAAAYLFYQKDHPLQRLMHTMKYLGRPMIAYYLAVKAAAEYMHTDFFEGIDAIIPVPLHPNRLRHRGYNQAEYIARGLSDVTGIPVDTSHLTRVKDTPQQAQIVQDKKHGLSVSELRKANMQDAFAVHHPEQLYRKHLLLVDDIITTGETMRACMQAMKVCRGAKISVFALCKTH